MGWTVVSDYRPDKAEKINYYILKNYTTQNENYEMELLDHSLRGNKLYILYRHRDYKTGKEIRSIDVYFLSFRNGFGYKGISICNGPYAYDAPRSMVARISMEPGDLEWVRDYLKHQQAKAEQPKISMTEGTEFVYNGVKYILGKEYDKMNMLVYRNGVCYRMKKKNVRTAIGG